MPAESPGSSQKRRQSKQDDAFAKVVLWSMAIGLGVFAQIASCIRGPSGDGETSSRSSYPHSEQGYDDLFFSEAKRRVFRDELVKNGVYSAADAEEFSRELWEAEQRNRLARTSESRSDFLSHRGKSPSTQPSEPASDPVVIDGDPKILGELKALTPEQADQCARLAGPISLPRLKTISVQAAEKLASHDGPLALDGLVVLDLGVAQALSIHNGVLSLNGVEYLTDKPVKVAAALARHQGELNMNGLKTITYRVAESLAATSGTINLLGLEALSGEAVAVLRNRPSMRIPETFR
jgi:hypothetical protein